MQLVNGLKKEFKEKQNQQEEEAKENVAMYIPLPQRDCRLYDKIDDYNDAPEETKQSGLYQGTIEANPEENPNFEKDWMSKELFEKPEYSKPRMFSMNQLKDLIHLHLSRSEAKRRLSKQESVVEFHDTSIFEQGRAHK